MGDTGSLVCGFILSALLIRLIEVVPFPNAPILAMSIVFVPIVDTLRITFIRIINGRSPFSSDKNHIHHKLLFAGINPIAIVGILSLVNFSTFLLFWWMSAEDVNINLLVFGIMTSLFILSCHFLKEKKNMKEDVAV